MNNLALDKRNAKLMGVCAGVARWAGIDVTLTRLGLVVLTLVSGGTLVLLYLVAGLIMPAA